MNKPLRILSHSPSDALNALIQQLEAKGITNIKRIKRENSTYRGRVGDFIFNWGSSDPRRIQLTHRIYNEPEAVAIAANKLFTFDRLTEAGLSNNIPFYTTATEEAKEWASDGIVYCRTIVRGSQGNGIVVATHPSQVPQAPLYTLKVNRRREMRVHVMNGKVITFAQKKRLNPVELEDRGLTLGNDVRNSSNGWVFARDGVTLPESAAIAAVEATRALGLDFAAVDLAITVGAPKIFELNTAPGLEGTTLQCYVDELYKTIVEMELI